MANSLNKVTTKSILDATIATADIADDAVTEAKIADASVDEARLKISNSPTNGQFLSAQSGNTGGLTWATVSTDSNVKRTTASQVNLPTDAGSYTWTSIPANAFQIDIFLGRVSGDTAFDKHLTFRLGHAGSGGTIVASGYKSVAGYVEDSYQNSDAYSTFFGLMPHNYGEPAQIFSTSATLYRSYDNIWTFRSMTCRDTGSDILASSFWSNGFIDLGATLDRVQLYLTGGDFDMGVAGLSYLETV